MNPSSTDVNESRAKRAVVSVIGSAIVVAALAAGSITGVYLNRDHADAKPADPHECLMVCDSDTGATVTGGIRPHQSRR